MSKPFVLIVIDGDSHVRFLQTAGVEVGVVDLRVERVVTLFPEQDNYPDVLAAIHDMPAMSPGADDDLGSALAAIRRIRSGLTVVAGLSKLEEPA